MTRRGLLRLLAFLPLPFVVQSTPSAAVGSGLSRLAVRSLKRIYWFGDKQQSRAAAAILREHGYAIEVPDAFTEIETRRFRIEEICRAMSVRKDELVPFSAVYRAP